ncbi:MAG: hypothetical protein OXC91_00760 [Rhodobacteraceae bacterium]|nr:hypothetical protein [Paracoccaceae bacterium]
MTEAINLVFGTGLLLPIIWVGIKLGDEFALWVEQWMRRASARRGGRADG